MISTKKTGTPKYIALADELREQIAHGKLQPGDKLPTFAQMCAKYDVTPTTVTNVYAVLKQEGLIICERGRGSFVAEPQKNATGLIGVANMASAIHPYSVELMRGFQESASSYGRELLLIDETLPRDWQRMDGVIAHGSDANEILCRLPKGMPAVAVMTSTPNAVCVTADDYAGISELMEHLLSLGHRRIASLFDPLSPRRLSGYRAVLHEAGLTPDARWTRFIHLNLDQKQYYAQLGYEAMQQWLQEDWDELGFTAIVTQNDDTATGVIAALLESGKRVPENVSVTGFDGASSAAYARPALTTVRVPLREIGSSAVELLQKQIDSETVRASTLTLPVTLITGDSTGPAVNRTK
jgi:DNA-binding LacI/PurR family transcriptional regulator